MDKLKMNLEGIMHYTEQVNALVDYLIITKASDPRLNEASGAVWSAIEHLTLDIKDEIEEFLDGTFQQHKEVENRILTEQGKPPVTLKAG